MAHYQDAGDVARSLRPQAPVFCNRPDRVRAAARVFLDGFAGRAFYAVKANPSPWLLDALWAEGVRAFEVASIAEARQIRAAFPGADIAFMHPIKSREAISEAYRLLGVRAFALDHEGELDKILEATGHASDLTLILRCAVANPSAKISLAKKFGASGPEAAALLSRMRQVATRLGVSFHVGSQTMDPQAYVDAIDAAERVIVAAGVIVDVLDVGGGFPARYPGMTPPPLGAYFRAIETRFEQMLVAENCELWCEPGRALCADAASLLIRVEGRKGDDLYVNEGVYGALFDAGHLNWPFAVRRVGAGEAPSILRPYRLYGPTCDDLDVMEGPFVLPADMSEGDYLEVQTIGAYGAAMRTGFNGFGRIDDIVLAPQTEEIAAPAIRAARSVTHG